MHASKLRGKVSVDKETGDTRVSERMIGALGKEGIVKTGGSSFIQPFNSHVFRAHVILHPGLGAGGGVVHIQQEREIINKF